MNIELDILTFYSEMEDLDNLRTGINEIDNQIFSLLIQRLGLVYNIGEIKKNNNLEILDKERENNIYSRIDSQYHGRNGLFLKDIYKTVMNESKRIQKE
jgi:chorismate mutase|tara:strand:- start:10033 stop:10329 length:297 start_codon:yes stop_codon:yes gene_type:complete